MAMHVKLEHLKEMLIEESDFNKIYNEFFSTLQNEKTLCHGKLAKNDHLEEIITEVLKNIYDKTLMVKIMMIHVEKFEFLHGTISVDTQPGSFFYFEDISMGMIAITTEVSQDIAFVRFMGTELSADGCIFSYPSKAIH